MAQGRPPSPAADRRSVTLQTKVTAALAARARRAAAGRSISDYLRDLVEADTAANKRRRAPAKD